MDLASKNQMNSRTEQANNANKSVPVRSVRTGSLSVRMGERTEQHPIGVFCSFACPPEAGE